MGSWPAGRKKKRRLAGSMAGLASGSGRQGDSDTGDRQAGGEQQQAGRQAGGGDMAQALEEGW